MIYKLNYTTDTEWTLMTDEDLSDYSTEILQVLDELEITD